MTRRRKLEATRDVGRGALRALSVLGRGIGRGVAAAYHAVDPDARRHLAELPLYGLSMLAGGGSAAEPLPDDGAPPVVLVHGLGGHPGNFLLLRAWFRLLGRRRTYAIAFPRGATIDEMAACLAEYVAAIGAANGVDKVDVVAHSLGGIVARCALDDPATAARVGTLVTLGTPHAGTYAARYGNTSHVRTLRPDSPLMRRLSRQLPWAGGAGAPRLVSFWSTHDVLLLPHTTACVAGADNRLLEDMTHLDYLLWPRVWQEVIGALGDGRRPRLALPDVSVAHAAR